MTSLDPRKPPKDGTAIVALIVVAVMGVVFPILGEQLYFRTSSTHPNITLERAEKDFRKGNDQAAIALFTELANKNDPVAQYWLAHMTELGLGVPRDPTKSVALYKEAADRGVVPAELRLGEIYLHGDLVPPDFTEAKSYLKKAAYHGNARAAVPLGQMYRIGLGTSADQTQSYAWSEVATVEGSTFAKRERDASLRDISAKDQQAAISRATEILKKIKQETASPKPPKPSAQS